MSKPPSAPPPNDEFDRDMRRTLDPNLPIPKRAPGLTVANPAEVRGFVSGPAHQPPDAHFRVWDPLTEIVWELDGYTYREGQREYWTIHTICPICEQQLCIDSRKKKIEVDRDQQTLYIERFRCSWPAKAAGKGGGKCPFHATITPPRNRVINMVTIPGMPPQRARLHGEYRRS